MRDVELRESKSATGSYDLYSEGNRGVDFHEFELLHRLREAGEIFVRLRESSMPELALQQQLRREFSDELVRAAITLVELRRKGEAKFSRAAEMWFDRVGLEQATAEPVARHKAKRFAGRVWDYCCGIGGDALALADGCEVVAVDADPAACLRTTWNAEVYGVAQSLPVVCADVERLHVPRRNLVHIDPDRRPGGRGRVGRVEDCRPGLPFLLDLTRTFAGGGIKLSAAANFMGKFPGAEVELISLAGECKEATVWFGGLAGKESFRATVLPAGETLAGNPLDALSEVAPLGEYLYDPDPAVVRSGLVDLAAEQLALWRLDEAEEYLSSDQSVASAFVRRFKVLAELPNNERAIRNYFRESGFGQVEIKCRHVPIAVEAVRRKLPLAGNRPAVLIFAKLGGKTRAVVGVRES
jgi:hypothetical protein